MRVLRRTEGIAPFEIPLPACEGSERAGASALATDVALDYLFPAGVAFVPPRV